MKYIFLIMILNALVLFAEETEIILKLGDIETRKLSTQSNVWIESSQVISASSHGTTLILKAKKYGSSIVKMNDRSYNFHVLSLSNYIFVKKLKQLLANKKGLELKIIKGEIYVHGHLLKFEDFLDLAQITPLGHYKLSLKTSPKIQNHIQNYINRIFLENNLPQYKITFSDTYKIKVHETDPNIDSLINLIHPHGIIIEKSKTSLNMDPLIKVSITIAEVKKTFDQTYGFKWPNSISENQVIDNNEINLQALESSGHGKVLAQPNLICKSGKEAEFLAGGEIPIKIVSLRNNSIIWKKYGIILKIKPVADWSGKISINLESEISTIDASQSVDGLPGFLTNRVQSYFDLNSQQTLILSGLIKSEQAKAVEGLPVLSQIPILGNLFASQNFKENKSELIILVKPEIIKSEVY